MKKIKRIIYIIIGCIGVGLGAIGAVLPLLPSFPFLMIATFCFARSSERPDNRFRNTKLYKNNFDTFARGEGMTWKTKIKVMITVTVLMTIGFLMMSRVPVGRIILAVVWVLHIIMFTFVILKTIANDTIICNAAAKRREAYGFVFSMYSDPAAIAAAAFRRPFQIIFYII